MNTPFNKLHDERGSTLVEALVSSVLMIIIATAIFGALEASGRAGAQERHRARAYAIAQDDQARLRSLKISDLTRLSQTSTVTQDGITYTITSTGAPKLDRTATAACDSGNSPADYVAISSTVTWTSIGSRPPAVVESIVAPPNGTLDSTRGALGVSVVDSRNAPYSGMTISGSGASSFSGQTTSTGCVIFGDLTAGNYTVTAAASNVIDSDGNPPTATPTSVVAGSSNTLSLQYDRPSGFTVGFRTIKSGTTVSTTTFDQIRVYNTGMTQSRAFGNAGTFASTVKATGLFPFSSSYAVWAGSCDANNPGSGLAIGNYTVPVGQTAPTAANFNLQLPSLSIQAYKNTSSYNNGGASSGATVTVDDNDCPEAGTRTYTTNSSGRLPEYAALPWGRYDICISGPSSSGNRRLTYNNVDVKNPSDPTDITAYLRNGSTYGSC